MPRRLRDPSRLGRFCQHSPDFFGRDHAFPDRSDPEPKLSQALLAMLRDLAAGKATTLPAPEYRMSQSMQTKVATQLAGLKRFAFIEEQFEPDADKQHSSTRILRYRLTSEHQTGYYTFQMTRHAPTPLPTNDTKAPAMETRRRTLGARTPSYRRSKLRLRRCSRLGQCLHRWCCRVPTVHECQRPDVRSLTMTVSAPQ